MPGAEIRTGHDTYLHFKIAQRAEDRAQSANPPMNRIERRRENQGHRRVQALDDKGRKSSKQCGHIGSSDQNYVVSNGVRSSSKVDNSIVHQNTNNRKPSAIVGQGKFNDLQAGRKITMSRQGVK